MRSRLNRTARSSDKLVQLKAVSRSPMRFRTRLTATVGPGPGTVLLDAGSSRIDS